MSTDQTTRLRAERDRYWDRMKALEREVIELRKVAAVVRKANDETLVDFGTPTGGVVQPVRIYPAGLTASHWYLEFRPGYARQVRVRSSQGGLFVTSADNHDLEIGIRR